MKSLPRRMCLCYIPIHRLAIHIHTSSAGRWSALTSSCQQPARMTYDFLHFPPVRRCWRIGDWHATHACALVRNGTRTLWITSCPRAGNDVRNVELNKFRVDVPRVEMEPVMTILFSMCSIVTMYSRLASAVGAFFCTSLSCLQMHANRQTLTTLQEQQQMNGRRNIGMLRVFHADYGSAYIQRRVGLLKNKHYV